MKVLLTGASGFMGRHSLAALSAAGHTIVASSRARLGVDRPGVRWIACDLRDARQRRDLVAAAQAEVLIHLGWRAAHGDFSNAPDNEDWLVAGVGLAREFVAAGGRRMVLAGSCFEYDWRTGVCIEDFTPLNPSTYYGACKVALHAALCGMAHQAGVSVAWARIFFSYGPGEHASRLVAALARKLLKGEPAEMTHGRQIRDYVFVEDIALALRRMVETEVNGAFNIGTGEVLTLRDIATEVARQVGRPDLLRIGALEPRAFEPPIIIADTRRTRELLQWHPTTSLETGISASLDAIRAETP